MSAHVDGNAAAGVLSELFRFDMTSASGRCAGCGDLSVLARGLVWETPMGVVLRCGHCGDVLVTIVERDGTCWIDLRGVTGLHINR